MWMIDFLKFKMLKFYFLIRVGIRSNFYTFRRFVPQLHRNVQHPKTFLCNIFWFFKLNFLELGILKSSLYLIATSHTRFSGIFSTRELSNTTLKSGETIFARVEIGFFKSYPAFVEYTLLFSFFFVFFS